MLLQGPYKALKNLESVIVKERKLKEKRKMPLLENQ